MEERSFIDVDFQDTKHEHISGKPLYYSTSQVSQIINESDSTVRFWCAKFRTIIKPEMSGSHRRFSENDIERLRYIKKLLREEGYSINQVIEYAGETNKDKAEMQIHKQEPLAMQALATAVAIEVGSQLEEYKLMIRDELLNELKNSREVIKEHIVTTVDEVVTEKLDSKLESFKAYVDQRELEAKQREDELFAMVKASMEDRKKLAKELEKEKSKGLFKKLFSR